jgi:hypothetical protein
MNSTNRLLLVLMGAIAWTVSLARADFNALFDGVSDVFRLPALIATWDDLQSKAAQLDQRFAVLQRLHLARQEVLVALRGRRIDVSEAIHRFGALTAGRSQIGIFHDGEPGGRTRHDLAVQLLHWVVELRKEPGSPADVEALDQAAAELMCCVESGE